MTPIALLDEDATVGWVDLYGTEMIPKVIWFIIRDGQNHGTQICLDVRVGSPSCNRLFVGRHPNKPWAFLLERPSLDERKLLAIFKRWLDSGEDVRPYGRDVSWPLVELAMKALSEHRFDST
jgi:hypothetical protein